MLDFYQFDWQKIIHEKFAVHMFLYVLFTKFKRKWDFPDRDNPSTSIENGQTNLTE